MSNDNGIGVGSFPAAELEDIAATVGVITTIDVEPQNEIIVHPYVDKLKAENAKLRELVRLFCDYYDNPIDGPEGEAQRKRIAELRRELGLDDEG